MTEAATRWPVGADLGPLVKVMTLEAMSNEVMAGGNPIHFDAEFARSVGLRAPIATGMISTGFLTALLLRAFGEHWLASGRNEVTFIRPVFAGDEVTCHAVVRACDTDSATLRLGLDLWCENQHGEKVTVGMASVAVPRE